MKLTMTTQQFVLPEGHDYFGNCHASTVAALPGGRLRVAWFAGEKEGSGDTAIWLACAEQGRWLPPVRIAWEDGLAHWNPVLHQQAGKLWLFYKVGADVHHWQTRVMVSTDDGASWSAPCPLVPGDSAPRGPVKNKLLVMSNGEWLAPASVEDDRHWDAFVDLSGDQGRNWQAVPIPLTHRIPGDEGGGALWQGLEQAALWENDLTRVFQWDGVIQPSAWESAPGRVHVLMRSTRGALYRSDSDDYGRRWREAYAIDLPNNNSGVDLAHLGAGRLVLVYNPVTGNWRHRYPLTVACSVDNGEHWENRIDLEQEPGEFSYPAIIADGATSHAGGTTSHAGGTTLHVTYTWNRKNIVYCALIFSG
ncbi:sialidase family protein [Dickeya fangzhongdai]|uniref:sialidase family protein n=1 Tax=Dickeya fangzhongdai TaxID=1778540 RepID=UPI0006760D4C|nr:exo-alpha-sialidase [Dickeya fangzhongdai]